MYLLVQASESKRADVSLLLVLPTTDPSRRVAGTWNWSATARARVMQILATASGEKYERDGEIHAERVSDLHWQPIWCGGGFCAHQKLRSMRPPLPHNSQPSALTSPKVRCGIHNSTEMLLGGTWCKILLIVPEVDCVRRDNLNSNFMPMPLCSYDAQLEVQALRRKR
ncbi:hypothetical protein BC835DRAFT_1303182 [Cytidiella melzeri]|nr:hypothetical protein BC835DRAFT_1303182 [Cytidiella melzeri]